MAAMQQIEHPVGEDDPSPFRRHASTRAAADSLGLTR
jgi:hypothetical protein